MTGADLDARYRENLVRYFRRRLDVSSEAEDYAQEVLIRLLSSGTEGVNNLDAYVFQVAGNLTRDSFRRNRVRRAYANDHARDTKRTINSITPEQIVGARRELDDLIAKIEAMPEPTRRIFILVRFENMTIKAAAETLSVSQSTIKNHLSRALVRLTDIKESV